MNRKMPVPLCAFELKVEPLTLSESRGGLETSYQVFKLTMSIEGRELTTVDTSPLCLDGIEMWLSQRYERASAILTCSCGILECAGFQKECRTSRTSRVLTWSFPEEYFTYLEGRGLASGRRRALTFHFDAAKFNQQLQQVFTAVRTYEAESGKPSGFEAGSYTAPRNGLDKQLQNALVRHLRDNKARRYLRHRGPPPGVCAGS